MNMYLNYYNIKIDGKKMTKKLYNYPHRDV